MALRVSWSVGVLECWSVGVLECWSVGVLECWSVGVLECWSTPLLHHSTTPCRVKRPRPVHPLVCVRAEKVSLSLDQIGRQPLTAVPVVIGQRRGEGGYRDFMANGGSD